jgi:hypothetical protein
MYGDIWNDGMELDNDFILVGYFDLIRIFKRIAKSSK